MYQTDIQELLNDATVDLPITIVYSLKGRNRICFKVTYQNDCTLVMASNMPSVFRYRRNIEQITSLFRAVVLLRGWSTAVP